jgi:hypothetical protein
MHKFSSEYHIVVKSKNPKAKPHFSKCFLEKQRQVLPG